jgi:hypothetical protein
MAARLWLSVWRGNLLQPAALRTLNAQLRKFIGFVHESLYLTLSDQAIHALRLAAIAREKTP